LTSLYSWLLFAHLSGLALFLFGHGIAGGSALALRSLPGPQPSRRLLRLSQTSYAVAYPGLLLLIVSGVWMGFLGGWWGRSWIWASIGLLLALMIGMAILSAPYHLARKSGDDDAGLDSHLANGRPLTLTWLGVVGLAALLFLMVFKPF